MREDVCRMCGNTDVFQMTTKTQLDEWWIKEEERSSDVHFTGKRTFEDICLSRVPSCQCDHLI